MVIEDYLGSFVLESLKVFHKGEVVLIVNNFIFLLLTILYFNNFKLFLSIHMECTQLNLSVSYLCFVHVNCRENLLWSAPS